MYVGKKAPWSFQGSTPCGSVQPREGQGFRRVHPARSCVPADQDDWFHGEVEHQPQGPGFRVPGGLDVELVDAGEAHVRGREG